MKPKPHAPSIVRSIATEVALLFIVGITLSMTQPFESLVAIEYLSFTTSEFGVILFGMAVFGAFVNIMMGYLSDIVRNRQILILFALLAGVLGYGVFSIFQNRAAFLICILVFNPFALTSFYQLFASVRNTVDNSGTEDPAAVNSVVRAIFAGSWIIGPFLIGLLVSYTQRATDAFVVATFGYLVCVLIGVFFGRRDASALKNSRDVNANWRDSVQKIISRPIFLRLIGIALVSLAHPVNATLLPIMMNTISNEAVEHIGFIFGLVAALEIPFMLLLIPVSRRLGLKRTVMAGGVLFSGYLILLSLSTTVIHLYLITVVNAAGAAIMLSLHISYLQNLLPGRPGLSTSLLSVGNLISRSTGALIVGSVGVILSIKGAIILAAILVFAGVVLLFFVERWHPLDAD
jgi:SET family sugar efflux transporter-like MFS transporter